MKGKDLTDEWEERLKSEGLAPVESTYRRMTEDGTQQFTTIARTKRAQFSDYFTRCEEFSEQLRIRSRIWELYSQGASFATIARVTGKPLGTVINRIRKTRREMVFYFARIQGGVVPPEAKSAAEILEIFVEADHITKRGK